MLSASQTFEIVFDPASLERSDLGSITGCIAVQSGDFAFPELAWSDFPAIVIRWWIDAARTPETGTSGRFIFMDGPFEFTATPVSHDCCELSFMSHSRQVFTSQARVSDVLTAIRRVGNQIVEEFRSRKWQSKEVDEISYAVR